MGNPGSPASLVPLGDDAQVRKQRDAERRQQEEAAARRGDRMQIGDGGVVKVDGTLEVTGDLQVPSGALSSAGSMTAGEDVSAGQDVLAGRHVIAQGNIQAIGNIGAVIATASIVNGTGAVRSVGVYNNLLTSGYRVQYIDSSGDMGYVPSSIRFKQDVETAPDVREAMLAIRVVTFRYLAAVEAFGEGAAIEWGVIAEELHGLGLTWAVDYDEDDLPFGVKYDRLVLAVIPVVQDHEARLNAAGL